MPTFTSNQALINYQTFGDHTKPALIFSNSLGTQFSMWQPQLDALKKDFYMICYDTRGHGQSSAPQGPYSIELLGEDVIHLMDHLHIDKANFCGISMGGLTGQWLAINHPERFEHVIVANTAAQIGQEQAWKDRASLVREQGLEPIASTAATRWFTKGFIKKNAKIVDQLSHNLAQGSPEGYASCCEALAVADLRDQIQGINIPVLVIAGSKDPVTTIKDGQYMVNNIRSSALFEIDASHISNIEQPQAFNKAIFDFIQ